MNKEPLTKLRPKRIEALIRKFDDELLVYDALRYRGHSLNKSAAGVWLACDGKTSVAEIIQSQTRGGLTEPMVRLALCRLQKARLLEPDTIRMVIPIGRREVLRKLGIAAGVLAPLVTSLMIPPAASAASCFPLLHSCSTNAQCCSGHCGLSGVNLVCLP